MSESQSPPESHVASSSEDSTPSPAEPDERPAGAPPGVDPWGRTSYPDPGAPPPGAYPPPPGTPVSPPPYPGYGAGPAYPPSWPAPSHPLAAVPAPPGYPPPPPPPGDTFGHPRIPAPPGASPGRPKRTRRIVVVVSVVVLVLVGGGVALAVTSGSSSAPSSRVSPAAARLVRTSLAKAAAAHSFHYTSRSTSQGATGITVGDAGPTSGRQVITEGPDTFTVVVVGAACYFQGDATQVQEQLGLSSAAAATHANQWISLAPGDAPYASVYVAVTSASALKANVAFRPHLELGTSSVSGHHVEGVSGPMTSITVAGQLLKAKGTAAMYVDTADHLPVRYTQHGTINGQASTLQIDFSKWGEPVSVTAPGGAVSFASINAGSGVTPIPGNGGGSPVLTAT